MLKIYCTCGAPNQYTIQKPKFCCQCGKSFDVASVQSTAQKISNQIKATVIETITDAQKPGNILAFEVEDESPKQTKIDFEVIGGKPKGLRISDLLNEGKLDLPPRKGKKQSRKQFLEEFQKEAGSRRPDQPPTEIGGDDE